MTAETARTFEALETQAQGLMGVFTRAGFEAVAPAIIQPADVFLDCIGEALRARTYVFTDMDGAELCLRPDLTIPTCRLHLERDPTGQTGGRYCYNGAAFRYQPAGSDRAHPREFRQAGIESIGNGDPCVREADILAVIVEAIDAAGVERRNLTLRFGDLSLFRALLDAIAMPTRWRHRLQSVFWRPQEFRAELDRLTRDPADRARRLPEFVWKLGKVPPDEIAEQVKSLLHMTGCDTFGARGVDEIADNVQAVLQDVNAYPLAAPSKALLEAYVAIDLPCKQAAPAIAALAKTAGIDLDVPLAQFERRLAAFAGRGLDLDAATFSGEFGRALEYYTGFVFEIGGPGLAAESPLAGGGRYDGLMKAAGCPRDLGAVGAAIHTERLLVASQRGL
jgi:ATP phosphoribosyltransferase regulatory subunit